MVCSLRRSVQILALLVGSSPALADDGQPEYLKGGVNACQDMIGYGSFVFSASFSNPVHRHFVVSSFCVARDGSWFAGPVTETGFVLTQGSPEFGGQYEILETGIPSYQRTTMSFAKAEGIIPISTGEAIHSFFGYFGSPETNLFPAITDVRSLGHAVDSAHEGLSDLGEGTWIIMVYPRHDTDNLTPVVVNVSNAALGASWFYYEPEAATGPPRRVGGEDESGFTNPWRGLEMDLTVLDGAVSGTLAFDYENPELALARHPMDYDTLRVEMREVIGRAVATPQGDVLIGQGAGRIIARNLAGQSQVYFSFFDIVGARLPEGTSPEDLERRWLAE